jgi:hypothetical protein
MRNEYTAEKHNGSYALHQGREDRQNGRLPGSVTGIFQRARKYHTPCLRFGMHHELVHVADPAVRPVAIGLVMQIIACPAPPARLNAMRLGRSPHVDFLGPWDHEGLKLACRARSALASKWPFIVVYDP